MGQYTNKGLYNSYDKNHKERDKLDYYATPPEEVTNILQQLDIDFSGLTILEPACGGGHMVKGIYDYCNAKQCDNVTLIATDIHEHKTLDGFNYEHESGEEFDIMSDDYPYDSADWVIMNPPFGIIEPFTIRALEISKKGIIMLARLQFLEGQKRFNAFLKDNPPTDVYVYVDRIQCWKGGVPPTGSSAQAYAWFIWDKENLHNPELHWIRKST